MYLIKHPHYSFFASRPQTLATMKKNVKIMILPAQAMNIHTAGLLVIHSGVTNSAIPKLTVLSLGDVREPIVEICD